MENSTINYNEVKKLFELPFMDLIYKAHSVHRQFQEKNKIQVSTLLSIKTGKCPEDCKYCPQSARYNTGLKNEDLMQVKDVIATAKLAKEAGSTRFCMGAAWKNPKERDLPMLEKMIKEVKSLGLETCMTLGMLTQSQADRLNKAGLDYYNHNLDTSKDFYDQIITTRTYEDRLNTLQFVRNSGMKICSGGILGLGEQQKDRINLLLQLASLKPHPESVPINMLVKVKGTPLADIEDFDDFEFIKTIAVARILLPNSAIRLSAGRSTMNEQMQALCFMAGANSIFYGCKLLTTPNPKEQSDQLLFKKLGINQVEKSQIPDEVNEEQIMKRINKEDPLFYDASI